MFFAIIVCTNSDCRDQKEKENVRKRGNKIKKKKKLFTIRTGKILEIPSKIDKKKKGTAPRRGQPSYARA